MSEHGTPEEVWQSMLAGNRRFVAGAPAHPHQDVDRRHELATGQRPRAALFGCADSRLAAEIIFDQGLGDLFVIRNAGQVISGSVVGSLEYAVAMLGVPLIIVLGHDACGAVAAAIESTAPDAEPLPPAIWRQVAPIVPAVRRVQAGDHSLAGRADPEHVGREHLRDTVSELLHTSEIIGTAVAAGTLAVAAVNYRLAEGTAVPDFVVGLNEPAAS